MYITEFIYDKYKATDDYRRSPDRYKHALCSIVFLELPGEIRIQIGFAEKLNGCRGERERAVVPVVQPVT